MYLVTFRFSHCLFLISSKVTWNQIKAGGMEADWGNGVLNFGTIQNQEANKNTIEMCARRVQENTNSHAVHGHCVH